MSRRALEEINREIDARRADAKSCAVLLRAAEATAAEASAALDAASASIAAAQLGRATAEGLFATSAALEDANAIDEADRAVRRTAILNQAAKERHSRAVSAFRSAEIAFNGNVGEIGILERERSGVIVAAEYDRTSRVMMLGLASLAGYAARLDDLRAQAPCGHELSPARFLEGLNETRFHGLCRPFREGVSGDLDKLRYLVRESGATATTSALVPVVKAALEIFLRERPRPLVAPIETAAPVVEVEASPVVVAPVAVSSPPPVEIVPAWRSGIRAMLDRLAPPAAFQSHAGGE